MKLEGKTNEELLKMRQAIENDPENHEQGIFLYTAKVRRKLNEIDLQITCNLAEKRKEQGRPVPVSGYSGRQSNRTR